MRSIAPAVVLGAVVLTLACNRAGTADDASSRENPSVADSGVGTSGQASDTVSHGNDGDARHFAIQSSKAGAAEIELGRLAQQKARRADVKAFGAMMVRDHTKKNDKLKAAVTPHGVELNTELPDDSEALLARLQRLSGAEFDRAYMQAMVDAHQRTKTMVESRLNDAKRMTTSKSQLELAVDQWAAEGLPGVEHHLMKATQVNDSLASRKNDTR